MWWRSSADVDAVFEAYQELADFFRTESDSAAPAASATTGSAGRSAMVASSSSAQPSNRVKGSTSEVNSNSNFKTAVYFYEKCLDLAELNSNMRFRATANLKLGWSLSLPCCAE